MIRAPKPSGFGAYFFNQFLSSGRGNQMICLRDCGTGLYSALFDPRYRLQSIDFEKETRVKKIEKTPHVPCGVFD